MRAFGFGFGFWVPTCCLSHVYRMAGVRSMCIRMLFLLFHSTLYVLAKSYKNENNRVFLPILSPLIYNVLDAGLFTKSTDPALFNHKTHAELLLQNNTQSTSRTMI